VGLGWRAHQTARRHRRKPAMAGRLSDKQQNARHKLAGDPEVSRGDARSVRGARSYEQILFDKPKNQPTGHQRPEKATPRIMNRYFRDKLI